MKIRFDVVALAHCDLRDTWETYIPEAIGRQLTFVPEPENVKDRFAIRAREGTVHVGYVSVVDQEAVYQVFHGIGRQRLKGTVVESNPKPPVLTVEIEADRIDWDYSLYDDTPFLNWHYDGISNVPKQLERMQDLTSDLIEELESGVTNRDTIIYKMVDSLLETNLYDVSREMTRDRYRIERLLASQDDEKLRQASVRLRQQKGLLMSHETREQVARYLFIDVPRKLRQRGFERSHYTHDNRLDQLEAQLRACPFQLYDKFQNDPVDFLREVFYNHVPRHQLLLLLSGILLMILKGRTDIRQWGRDGDTEPLEQIRALGKPQPQTEQTGPLFSEQAASYWQALEEAGFVGKDHLLLPSTSRQQAMYIAEAFAEKLGLKTKWKPFQDLWHINNLAQEKTKFQDTGKSPVRAEDIDRIFEE